MNPGYLGDALFLGVSEQPFRAQIRLERAAAAIACGNAVDVRSSQPPSLHAMNATGSMTEKQLGEKLILCSCCRVTRGSATHSERVKRKMLAST